jgi:hypothetical protein
MKEQSAVLADQGRPLVNIALPSPSDRALFAALWTYSDVHAHGMPVGNAQCVTGWFRLTWRRSAVMKFVIAAGATFALVTAASAADLPRRQPVYQEAPVGKMPIGKTPVGKSPVGKTPVGQPRY